jgi:glycerol-3-phosphate O-acyltransferase
MKKLLLVIPFLFFSGVVIGSESNSGESNMNQETLEKIIKSMALSSIGENGVVEFSYSNVKMYLISDVKHDRMRIISPVAEYKKLTRQHLDAVLESNFHKSLDARYAVSDGVLYSAFIHPLSELSENQIKSAVQQVANLASTFGKEYASGFLTYGGNQKH